MNLKDVKRANEKWFSKENQRFLGDNVNSYEIIKDNNGNYFMIYETGHGWEGLNPFWTIMRIDRDTLKLSSVVGKNYTVIEFNSRKEAIDYILKGEK